MSAVSFEELVETIGVAAAKELCDEHGGTTIVVSSRPRPNHPVVQTIGPDAAKRLFEHFSSGRLSLPLGPSRGQSGRRAQALKLVGKGYSVAEAARLADVHERTVYNAKRAERESSSPLLDLMLGKKPASSDT